MNSQLGWVMKLFVSVGLMALLVGCSGGGGSDEGVSGETARVRFVHGAQTVLEFDVFVNGELVVDNLSFTAESSFLDVEAGTVDISVVSSETGILLNEAPETFDANAQYTVVLRGSEDGFTETTQRFVFLDAFDEPAPETFNLRFLLSSIRAESVDIYFVGINEDLASMMPTVEGAARTSVSPYFTFPEGVYRIQVTRAGTTEILFDSDGLTFANGETRTVVLFDPDDQQGPIVANLLIDNL